MLLNNKNIDNKLAKLLSGNATQKEQDELARWAAESAENKAVFEKSKRTWVKADAFDDIFEVGDMASAWANIDQATEEAKVVKMPLFQKALRIAAVGLVLVACIWGIQNFFGSDTILVASLEGEQKEITLPDGTAIWLNEGSSITYTADFEERTVELEGEAFFDVVHNPNSPFVIYAGDSKTEVLGTAFNIRAYSEEAQVELNVVRGKVAFSEKVIAQERPILTAGMSAELAKNTKAIAVAKVEKSNAMAWKNNKLSFSGTQIRQVVEDLERYFNVQMDVQNPAILNCTINGNYTNPKLQDILNVLSFSLDLDVQRNENRIVITGEGCN